MRHAARLASMTGGVPLGRGSKALVAFASCTPFKDGMPLVGCRMRDVSSAGHHDIQVVTPGSAGTAFTVVLVLACLAPRVIRVLAVHWGNAHIDHSQHSLIKRDS
jgi:hypothetical protein